ncbi:MAG: HAMP domain-containing sensor histidine kinase [Elusimicrobiales bacterium]
MKNISLYSVRFRMIECIAYFMLPIPWIPDFLPVNALPYGILHLTVKIILSAVLVAFVVLLRDVRKKINSLDILKQDLSMAAIHDLKGPLTSIIGTLSLVSEPDMDLPTKEKLLNVASQSSQSMIRLIQTLVDTERMEVAKLKLQPEMFDLRSHITECMAPFNPVSVDMGIKLELEVEDKIPAIRADKELLGRVYENLLLNAFKYSRRGGEIRVSVRFSEENFYFEIKDTGSGISAEFIDKVFDKYYRVEGREQDSRKGSGLGLYFCRLAIEAHDGKIRIESKKNEGTRVFFEIPQSVGAVSAVIIS